MKYFFFVLLLITASCGTTRRKQQVYGGTFQIERVKIAANSTFGGNIVVRVYDTSKSPIQNYQSILRDGKKVIFDVPQKESQCTFFKDGKELTIEIIKDGYKRVKTEVFNTLDDEDFGFLIRVYLEKEK